jgi:hypothetical protein
VIFKRATVPGRIVDFPTELEEAAVAVNALSAEEEEATAPLEFATTSKRVLAAGVTAAAFRMPRLPPREGEGSLALMCISSVDRDKYLQFCSVVDACLRVLS